MTVDLEPDLRSSKSKSVEMVIPKLLNYFDDMKIRATFFTVTNLLEKHEEVIKEISKKHEIASHSHSHNWLNQKNAELEISFSKKRLEEFGIKCSGFRAPGLITTKDHFSLLKKNGYLYDSSLGTFFPGRYNNFGMKQTPFLRSGILEFPIPTFVPPVINSGLNYLRLLYPISKTFPQKYLFYLHPWEFLEKKDLPKNKSFLQNVLSQKSGKKTWKIFTEFVDKEETNWVRCKDWIEIKENKRFI